MDIDKLKTYLKTIELGSFSAAADALGYTTSGVSRSVASLEDELGVILLVRGRGGVFPTADARELLPAMQELVHNARLFQEQVDALQGLERGTITIGICYAAYFRMLSRVIRQFNAEYPGIKIKTIYQTSSDLIRLLEQHQVDFAIMTQREGDFHFYELKEEAMVACLPPDFADDLKVYPLERFAADPMIATYVDKETDYRRGLAAYGIRPNIQYTSTDVYASYCMVEAGLGVTLSNRIEVERFKGKVRILPTEPQVITRIGIMYPDAESMTISARKFLNRLIKESF